MSIKILDIKGKRKVACPYCGFQAEIPLRTISMDKLRHMQYNKILHEWLQKKVGGSRITNARLIICPNCGNGFIGVDEFSILPEDIKKDLESEEKESS